MLQYIFGKRPKPHSWWLTLCAFRLFVRSLGAKLDDFGQTTKFLGKKVTRKRVKNENNLKTALFWA